MAKVTIVRDDNAVGVNGIFYTVPLDDLDENIHAVQWNGTAGFIEYSDDRGNQPITSIGPFMKWLDRYDVVKAEANPVITDLQRATAELATLRVVAAADIEQLRIEAVLVEEGGKLNGSPSAKAYVRAKAELAEMQAASLDVKK